ncbi:hypothetical protein CANMA_002657 [Candida margitis]|uniref:uncharacterized protein n=1 Tax=Candida margitis TaxID=1775924 RepID=UPI002227D4E2|nr:uncharacterized protein CANMA_002657 [Candida margitis]KAI5967889.1 hypothetical protein CANMA_002657 [Candida margitis]
MNKLKIMNLYFIPVKIFNQNQTWRLITSFITFGELSIGLVFNLWQISSSCQDIEVSYQTKFTQFPLYLVDDLSTEQLGTLRQFIDRNKSIDFLYFVLQICVSIIACASMLYYKMYMILPQLGLVLIDLFQYYGSKLSPLELVGFFGFRFKRMYLPYLVALATLLMSFAKQEHTPNQAASGTNWGSMWWNARNIFQKPEIWFYIISFGLGHLWWCSREIILGSIHYNDDGDATNLDEDDRSWRIKRRDLLKQNGIWKFDLVKEALVILMLPPWYWIILSKIKQQRPDAHRRQRRVPNEGDVVADVHVDPELHVDPEVQLREGLEQDEERAEEQVIRHLNQVD